jgi:hypothetical protein
VSGFPVENILVGIYIEHLSRISIEISESDSY